MSTKHFRIIAVQSVFALIVFLLFVYFFVRYDSKQLQNQINNMGQTLAFAIEKDVNISEGVLASFVYNYEIDPDLDAAKFEALAKHYLKVNPDIIYVQRKDKETTTVMVYPDTYNYTLGATLMGRSEVEEAVIKAIKDKIVTANSPFVLKDTEDLLGLVIRYPIYYEEIFNGFFVVVLNIDDFFKGIIDAEIMKDYNISFIDDNENLFWGYDGQHKGQVYTNNIPILDNFWTIQVSLKNNMMASTLGFVIGTTILFLSVVGLLVVMQIRLIKKDQSIQHLAISKKVLEKVKESYTLALDSANDALWEWNVLTGEIYTSDKWEKINGYEKVGQGINAILQKESIHPKDYEQSVLALEACLSGEKHTFDITYRTKNPSGNYFWIQNRGKVYLDDKGEANILAGSISNINERRQTEFKLVESEELLSRSQELAHIGSWNLDLTTNKLYWSDETYRILGCEPQEFTVTYEDFLEFIYPDDRSAVEKAYSSSVSEKSDSYEIEHRIIRRNTGEIRHVYERCVHVSDDAGDIIKSIGMVQDITKNKQTENELLRFAEVLEQHRKNLEIRLLQSVNAISKIGEIRDAYTAGHQKRVEALACAIGRNMGLGAEQINNISFGALIHDIGKFFIPSEILNKPGKISALEYQILQTHVEESFNVIKEIDFPEEIHTMVYQHHERLDGSGYPKGLSGDAIILQSRIIAVADVVEAMSSHRPYRAALGIDAALEEILLHRGTKYDAKVVDICVKLFKEDGYTL
jgi:PAS domain S-box-containing protein